MFFKHLRVQNVSELFQCGANERIINKAIKKAGGLLPFLNSIILQRHYIR